MELKLHIYDKKTVIKTYTAETYDIMFGTVEDLINLIDVDMLEGTDDAALAKLAMNVLTRGFGLIKPLIKDIFEGLTDEELRNTRLSEIAVILVEVVKFSLMQMGKGASEKNH